MADGPIDIAGAGRPHPHETVSGDAWRIDWHQHHCRITVVDGLGHGPAAAEAAQRALSSLAARPELGPVEAVYACHEALRSTRGAALTVVRIDTRAMRLSHAGAGNVDGRIWNGRRDQRLSPQRGIVGNVLPRLVVAEFDLADEWILIIHTDGISSRFATETILGEQPVTPNDIAQSLLERWSRPMDDATVVVARQSRASVPNLIRCK